MSGKEGETASDATVERILVGLSKVSLALKSQSWQEAGQLGLSPTQIQILSLLQTSGSEGMRLSEVAAGLAVTAATASDAVRVLEEKGLVQKTRSPRDRRAIAITLTPPGETVARETACWPDVLLQAVGELSEFEQTIFLQGLIKIVRNLQEAGKIPIAQMCLSCQFFHPHRYPDSERPHHCDFVDAPFGDRNLNLECRDRIPAPAESANSNS
ncbi:MarR family winged helix-turn-helix transcriptional regulator [Oscillatoria sp. FACHB-1406]|uniref:MarR family winged helix-turn-helix transcriptional regulator n=1 Tax=Oscillatoria sp. FACHB-1406 TaxID=2692846 RepID=UPI001683542D|nr:MarR family winged helix-turn-helix transcriptional regulator [Oscillatoria sp. FACHB-1406]MBD2580261.1 winged helix-turn-helix transcriptional regulator [Oscillatoria sp. FACHB-1406]